MVLGNWNPLEPQGIAGEIQSAVSVRLKFARLMVRNEVRYRTVLGIRKDHIMCRNIKTLFNFEPPATEDEVHASALQFVRKLSGFNAPSKANEAAFELAVAEVSASARKLLTSLHTNAPARDREIEAEKARERNRARFG